MLGRHVQMSYILRHQYHKQASPPLNKIIDEIRQFRGGSVDLQKNEDTGIANLILNYPENYNALSGWMMADLHEAVASLKGWKNGRGLIVRGAENDGRCFCSGGHLDTVRKLDGREKGFQMSLVMNNTGHLLRSLPLLTVSLLEGPAIGGGAEISTWTDHRLGTINAWVAFVQVKMGICTGFGGGASLVRCLGYSRAMDLLLTGRKLKFEEGLRLGFFDDLVKEENSIAEADKWIQKRLQFCNSHMIKNIKTIMRQEIEIPDEYKDIPDLEFESRLFAELWSGPAHSAAIKKNIKHK